MIKSVTECKHWDIKTYDCKHKKGPIYCGKYNFNIPKECPLRTDMEYRPLKPDEPKRKGDECRPHGCELWRPVVPPYDKNPHFEYRRPTKAKKEF